MKRFRRSAIPAVLLSVLTALFAACGDDTETGNDGDGMMNDEAPLAPAFALETMTGGADSLDAHRGKVVFVTFWATWCPPCREEMPLFQDLRERLGPEGFEILAINVDDPFDPVPEFVAELGVEFPILKGTNEATQAYQVIALPSTYVVNRDGRIVEILQGGQPLDVFEPLARKHL